MKNAVAFGLLTCLWILPALSYGAGSLDTVEDLSKQHRFKEALSHLNDIVEREPGHGGAWIKIASISLVTADVERAIEACRRAAVLVDPVVSVACQGRIALATEGRAIALERLTGLLALPQYRDRDDVETTWARSVAAELAAVVGEPGIADQLFERSLAGGAPEQTRVAYADHLLATDRPRHAISLLQGEQGGYALQLRRVLAYRRAGLEDQVRVKITRLDQAFRHELRNAEFDHAREIAFFFTYISPDRELAMQAAQNNIAHQKEPEDFSLLEVAKRL